MWAPQLRSASCLVARVGSASTRVDEKGEARECRLDDAIVIGGKTANVLSDVQYTRACTTDVRAREEGQ